jgi:uncharacterized protein (DUF2336 family)
MPAVFQLAVASVTHPPLRSDRLHGFADLARASERKRDAALLRATTELFVLDVVHNDDEMHRFEELATHFLPKVGLEDRLFVAERLAACADAPTSLLRMLARDDIIVAKPVLLHSMALAPIDLLAVVAGTGSDHHRLIARRPGLPDDVVQALRLTGDPEILRLLGDTTVRAPADLDRTRPSTGLYQSNRLDPWRYLALARPARLRLIADIAANPPAPGAETDSRRLDRAFRSILSAARIVGYARSGQLTAIVGAVAEGLELPPALVNAAINDRGGELLAIMLKALRLDDVQARQVFLLASPSGRDVSAFFPLAELYAGMEPEVAETMIEAWRSGSTAVAPRHEAIVEAPRERHSAQATNVAAPAPARKDESARRA